MLNPPEMGPVPINTASASEILFGCQIMEEGGDFHEERAAREVREGLGCAMEPPGAQEFLQGGSFCTRGHGISAHSWCPGVDGEPDC